MLKMGDSYSKQLNHYLSVLQGLDYWERPGLSENKNSGGSPIHIFPEDHVINSHGFRGKEFKKDTDLLFAGCSQTYGYALKEESIWGFMIAKENNIDYANLATPGASPMHIVFNIFKYFEEFGHPKTLLVLFPDFYRIRTFIDSKILNQRSNHPFRPTEQNIFVNSYGNHGENFLKYLKLPTTPDNIYSQEFTYMINSMFIVLLENYCNNNNINFIWTKTFNGEYYDSNEESFLSFKNYYKLDLKKEMMVAPGYSIQEYRDYTCHKNNENIDPTWNVAKDNAHFGTHINMHIKDFFEKILKEKNIL
jgi:hypothetical protein